MHNLGDDKELDRLSREAAGRYTPPGAANWDALNAELDKVMPAEEKKRRTPIFWWLLPALLVGGATAYWFSQKNDTVIIAKETATISAAAKENAAPPQENNAAKQETAQPSSIPTENTSTTSVEKPAASINSNTSNTDIKADRISIAKKAAPNENAGVVVRRKNVVSVNTSSTENKTIPNTNIAAARVNNDPAKNDGIGLTREPVKEDHSLMAAPTKENEAAKESTTTQSQTDNTTTAASNTLANKTEPATAPETPAVTESATPKKETTVLKPRGKGMSFGLLAGVDQSTVKFRYGNNAGYNLGIAVGYHFSDKLSIHTGAIYTEKKYKLAGEDFTAPKGSFIAYYKIETVDGYCRMWEVPLTARYTISQGNRNSVFVSTGLSSYFMTKENYDYIYHNNAGVLTTRNSVYNSTDTHIMSILHFSAGFENRLGKNMSMLIEPYAKLPLGGVGFGNIRLSSFGLNFSLQYRQPAKK